MRMRLGTTRSRHLRRAAVGATGIIGALLAVASVASACTWVAGETTVLPDPAFPGDYQGAATGHEGYDPGDHILVKAEGTTAGSAPSMYVNEVLLTQNVANGEANTAISLLPNQNPSHVPACHSKVGGGGTGLGDTTTDASGGKHITAAILPGLGGWPGGAAFTPAVLAAGLGGGAFGPSEGLVEICFSTDSGMGVNDIGSTIPTVIFVD